MKLPDNTSKIPDANATHTARLIAPCLFIVMTGLFRDKSTRLDLNGKLQFYYKSVRPSLIHHLL
jgi:hypothetical protein